MVEKEWLVGYEIVLCFGLLKVNNGFLKFN